jgi:precorrin-6B methylase 2
MGSGAAGLMAELMNALGPRPGDRVLDINAGPGLVSLTLAERVGPSGFVYASTKYFSKIKYFLKSLRDFTRLPCRMLGNGNSYLFRPSHAHECHHPLNR